MLDSGDFFKGFMNERNSHIQFINVPTNDQKNEYNADFTGLVMNLWFGQKRDNSSKLALSLQGLLEDMRSKYQDPANDFTVRSQFAYLYFLTFTTVQELKGTTDTLPTTSDNGTSSGIGTMDSSTYMPANG